MPLRPLHRQLLIGGVVALCIAGAAVATWWAQTHRANDSLASRLPLDAVLLYAEAPFGDLSDIYPSFPAAPETDARTEAMALVQAGNTVGWISMIRNDDGSVRVQGSDPALESILHGEGLALADDPTFDDLRWHDGDGWLYVWIPDDSPAIASRLGTIFALDTPIAIRSMSGALAVRFPRRSMPAIQPWTALPQTMLSHTDHIIQLPSWDAMAALSRLLTPHTDTIVDAMATTFLADIAPGLSLQYDVAPLLNQSSLLRIGTDGAGRSAFSLEGTGEDATTTADILRALHEQFASSRGGSQVKTVTADGFVLQTVTHDRQAVTTERTDGTWTVLETQAGNEALLSARNGARFAVTNEPQALLVRHASGATAVGNVSTIRLTEAVRDALRPLWPTIESQGETLTMTLENGPGYVEWSLDPLKAL